MRTNINGAWIERSRNCVFVTKRKGCVLIKGKNCNRRNCILFKNKKKLKITVYLRPIENKIQHTILRKDIIRFLMLFEKDYSVRAGLFITKKDWGKLDKMNEENKIKGILRLIQLKFKNQLEALQCGMQ